LQILPCPEIEWKGQIFRRIARACRRSLQIGQDERNFPNIRVEVSPEKEVERAADLVKKLKKYNVPIGVSVYPTKDSSRILKEAGASEVKYNVETMDRELYEKYCKKPPLDFTLECLKDAVKIFGKNNVLPISLPALERLMKQLK